MASYFSELESDRAVHDLPITMRRLIVIFGIGKFIQMDSLTQACEDKLTAGMILCKHDWGLKCVSGLSSETIIPLLKWSESSHGSPFISRFCISFIRSNFIQLSKLGILNLLSTEEMIRLFQDSAFLLFVQTLFNFQNLEF